MKPDPSLLQDVDAPAPRDWSVDEERALRMWISLARSYSTFSKVVGCKIAEYDLTMPQFGVIEALYHLGPLSLGELADKLLVTGGNVTYVMDRLEDMGLVYRQRSPSDRRVVRAHLTAEGRDRIGSVFAGHAAYIHEVANHLSKDEQDTLRQLLKKLGTAIKDSEATR